MQPTRHALGALLLEQGQLAEAEAVYRADLGYDGKLSRACQHPDNVWSLHGLHECLTRRGDTRRSAADQGAARSGPGAHRGADPRLLPLPARSRLTNRAWPRACPRHRRVKAFPIASIRSEGRTPHGCRHDDGVRQLRLGELLRRARVGRGDPAGAARRRSRLRLPVVGRAPLQRLLVRARQPPADDAI